MHQYNDLLTVYKILNGSYGHFPDELKGLFLMRNNLQYN